MAIITSGISFEPKNQGNLKYRMFEFSRDWKRPPEKPWVRKGYHILLHHVITLNLWIFQQTWIAPTSLHNGYSSQLTHTYTTSLIAYSVQNNHWERIELMSLFNIPSSTDIQCIQLCMCNCAHLSLWLKIKILMKPVEYWEHTFRESLVWNFRIEDSAKWKPIKAYNICQCLNKPLT